MNLLPFPLESSAGLYLQGCKILLGQSYTLHPQSPDRNALIPWMTVFMACVLYWQRTCTSMLAL